MDSGNARKNERHGVPQDEAEQVFFHQPLLEDPKHSEVEPRYHALGKTTDGRLLHLSFTIRAEGKLIRVISARAMTKPLKPTPKVRAQAAERKFRETHDTTPYLDWSTAQPGRFTNLKPSTKSISLRLPVDLLERIKVEANRRDVPYQSLIKVWLSERPAEGSVH